MFEEILNIEYHYERLAIAALNKHKDDSLAAADLGISRRTLCRWKKRFFLRRDVDGSYYQLPRKAIQLYTQRKEEKQTQKLMHA